MNKCQAAIRWSVAAFVLAVIALIYSTWYLPGLIKVLKKLSLQVERFARTS